jgi:hypothetical protein
MWNEKIMDFLPDIVRITNYAPQACPQACRGNDDPAKNKRPSSKNYEAGNWETN